MNPPLTFCIFLVFFISWFSEGIRGVFWGAFWVLRGVLYCVGGGGDCNVSTKDLTVSKIDLTFVMCSKDVSLTPPPFPQQRLSST